MLLGICFMLVPEQETLETYKNEYDIVPTI